MSYRIKVSSPVEREAKIKAAIEASTKEDDFYEFRNRKTKLKVILVDIDTPIYRVENFRTYTSQKEYVSAHEDMATDYFLKGQENQSVQQIQHQFLAGLAAKGRAESVVPVIDVLRKNGQREWLLITHGGIVVNGNRRLAGMRELFSEDPTTYASFSHVECAVLPSDATPDEIVDIEAALQARPETKLDYDWIGEASLIAKLIARGRDSRQVADMLNRKDKDVKNAIKALSEAELYLKEWAGAEGEYSRIRDDGRQFFKDLPTLLEGKDVPLQEASRAIAWTLFDNRKRLDDRLYEFNRTFGRRAADVIDRLANGLGIPLEDQSEPETAVDGSFQVELDEDEQAVSYEGIIQILKDPARREEATASLIGICKDIIESDHSEESGDAAKRAVIAAHAKLVEVDLSKASPSTHLAIGKQLEAIIKVATDLQGKLAKYQGGPRSA